MKNTYLILALLGATLTIKSQTVNTQYGAVTGHLNGSVYEFLGIPYASPPTDSLRWRPTIPPSNWTTPFVADSFPPICPQKNYTMGDTTYTLEGQEDCLYLNVWSPNIAGNYPVMLFIHGGGNQQGSTSQISGGTEFYHGKNLSERGDVVIVTIQYRLGALGYLAHPGLEQENPLSISGNYGVMDQLFALQWVQDNISAFGGNPSNVTIFGESGGGVNVGNLITTQQANGLFHKAIIQSATPVINNYDTAKAEGSVFVNDFITTGNDATKIAYMRTVHADSISLKNSSPLEGGVVQMAWQPVLDNHIFSNYPEAAFQSGNFNHVPLIIGSNADEMQPLVPTTVFPLMVSAFINLNVPPAYQSTALSLYPPGTTNQEAKESYVGILTDIQFTNTSRKTAQCVSLNQTEPVYRYFFSHTHNPAIPILGNYKSYHGIELFYVFNTWENSPLAFGSLFTNQDDSVQTNILQYWTNFAHNGDPNAPLLPQWSQYDASTDCYLEIKATPNNTQCGLRTAKCDLWDDVSGYTMCTSSVGTEDYFEQSDINIYPNPTNRLINITSESDQQVLEVSIYNLIGKKLQTIKNKNKIDISNLPTGTYFLKAIIDGKIKTKKIVKID